MTKIFVEHDAEIVLPPSVVTKLDLARFIGEAEQVDNDMTTSGVRDKVGASQSSEPVLSDQFSQFLEQNQLSLDSSQTRSSLIRQLRQLKNEAPVVHMTFAVPVDRDSLMQLAQWLRQSVHAHAVVEVGLQPGLVAGVYVRSSNQVHDFSLRGALDGQHDALVKQLGELSV